MHEDLAVILKELERLNQAHGGTVMAHSRAINKIRNRLDDIHRRLYRIEKLLDAGV